MRERKDFDRSNVSQESQYAFPYHYIPSFENGHFSQHLYWSWGYSYLGGMDLVLSALGQESFENIVDIGCGDGRFLREVVNCFPGKLVKGIDFSKRAINLAKAMNPAMSFDCIDIRKGSPQHEIYDVVTLIEVLEHIPVADVESFVAAFARVQRPGGSLLLTVPHKNTPVSIKYYQHFDAESLAGALNRHYEVTDFIFFDKKSRVFSRIMHGMLGNAFFILNNQFLLDSFFKIYLKYYLHCSEPRCKRLFVRAIKR